MALYIPSASRESANRTLRASRENWPRDPELLEEWLNRFPELDPDLLKEWLYRSPELLETILTDPSGPLERIGPETQLAWRRQFSFSDKVESAKSHGSLQGVIPCCSNFCEFVHNYKIVQKPPGPYRG